MLIVSADDEDEQVDVEDDYIYDYPSKYRGAIHY